MSLHYTQEELNELIKANRETHFPSSFGFLNAHNGLRRKNLHLILGTTGGGKSTLTRAIIKDFLFKRENIHNTVCLWLTEEGVQSYKTQVAFSMPASEILYNTAARSEDDEPDISENQLFEWLNLIRPDVFILDNITTSKFYEDTTPRDQGQFVTRLKRAAKELNCAFIIIAHTGAGVSDTSSKIIELNDIMGGKSITRKVEFAYILQRFQVKDKFLPTIRTVKHRSQELINATYKFSYDPKQRIFDRDEAINFEKLKEIYATRDKF